MSRHRSAPNAVAVSCVSVLGLAAVLPASDRPPDAPVDFRRDVRPLLAENCFACHGPDGARREAGLRLDVRDEALRDRGGYAAIVPGKSAESEVYLRIGDPADPMPPADSEKSLDAAEVELIRRWIDEGAQWQEHWAYVPPRRPELPAVRRSAWVRNEIDRFVLARLEREGLTPSPEASRELLLRRATLDLTGLPPTLEELDAFLADESEGAYGRALERLLASPRYGEAMAVDWLDAARYGDTHGFHLDNERSMWPWRDWVVRAFNDDLPFDRFTIEQLAGDLLAEPTPDQVVATGFNRCNPTTAEGGLIEEEYLVKYAADRASTTAAVWMGTTLECAACHDHKFDPVSQEEFYALYAFFNNVDEQASDENQPAPEPAVEAPSAAQQARRAVLGAEIDGLLARLDAPMPEADAAQERWETAWAERLRQRWTPVDVLAFSSRDGAELARLEDGSILASGPNPDRDLYEVLAASEATGITALRLEALTHEDLPQAGAGRADNANFVLTEATVDAAPRAGGHAFRRVALAAAFADLSQEGFDASFAVDGDPATGWAVAARPEERTAVFAPAEAFGFEGGTLLRIRLAFDSEFARHALGRFRLAVASEPEMAASRLGAWESLGPFSAASGAQAYATDYGPEAGGPVEGAWLPRPEWTDGGLHALEGENAATYLRRTIDAPGARALTLAVGSDDGIRVWLNGAEVLGRDVQRGLAPDQDRFEVRLEAGANELLMKVVNHAGEAGFTFRRVDEALGGLPLDVAAALELPSERRSPEGAERVRTWYRRGYSAAWQALDDELRDARLRSDQLEAEIPSTLVMREREGRRPAHVLVRGRYDQKGKAVTPDVPAFLPPLPRQDGPTDRLALARWLVDPAHPLTARVTVNRLWQRLFGTGLVATAEDFGSQGEPPSHPELLDWLAVELVESGWDVKGLLKQIASSATYRQSSRVFPALVARDPENRLLARGPRFRLSAEAVRDGALAVSGLLVERVGGPPVKPYQPEGIWKAVAYTSSNTAEYEQGEGQELYRRSLYTFWKRTAPPPVMQLFDAPSREACAVRRARTNTPLQALAVMNGTQFVEAARAFAERTLREGGAGDEERVRFAFRVATARRPSDGEVGVLLRLLEDQRREYAADEAAARALQHVGESAPDPALDAREVAAWTCVTTTLLNLDETLTKG